MAEMNKNDDRTQAPKSRLRPQVKRPIIPPPGGLPLPPSRQQSVPSSSSLLPGFGNTTSNIETHLPRSTETPPLSGTMPIDLFGLPDFRFSMPSTSKTEFGFSGSSRIHSPKHLPGITNITIRNLCGLRSGIAGSSLSSAIQLPRPSNASSSRDQTASELPGMGASSASKDEDLLKRAKRPTDLPLFDVISVNPSSDQVPDGTSSENLPSSRTSKESPKSSNIRRTMDRKTESDIPNVPTSHMAVPAGVEINPRFSDLSEVSSMSLPCTSASTHLPGPSSNVASSHPQSSQRKRVVKRSSDPMSGDLPGPSGIRREGASMPSIAQHPGVARMKSESVMDKFKRFVMKKLSVKKKTGGSEDKEESTGLVFERYEDDKEPRRRLRPKEPEKKYRPFPTETYNHALDRDPIIPRSEIEGKCYVCENTEIGSPTISMISDSNTSKSEQDQESIGSSESQTPEPITRSNPTSPTAERTCTCISASETSEQVSSNPIVGISESTSRANPIAETSESASDCNPIANTFESASASDPIANASESANNPIAYASEIASARNLTADAYE